MDTTETPPEPLIVADPVLMETLAQLDQDVSGEAKFCTQAAESLRAFQFRWGSDHAVQDAYGHAILALDTMASVLSGLLTRQTQALTRDVVTASTQAQQAATAQTARDHALAWAETPPPPPADPVETGA
jgi:hypothetical protein